MLPFNESVWKQKQPTDLDALASNIDYVYNVWAGVHIDDQARIILRDIKLSLFFFLSFSSTISGWLQIFHNSLYLVSLFKSFSQVIHESMTWMPQL